MTQVNNMTQPKGQCKNIYIGMFLIAFSTLALEITLVRLLSVVTWYYLAFFAISTALLGMTAGAVTVYLRPAWFVAEKLNRNTAKACIGYGLSLPFALIMICIIPLQLNSSIMSFISFMGITVSCSLPFYFAGIAISAILTKSQLPIGKLYASDLFGASLGCLFVLGGLEIFDAPSLILLCGPFGVLAALSFLRGEKKHVKFRRFCFLIFGILTFVALANSFTSDGIRPHMVKGNIQPPASYYLLEKWNSFSRIVVYPRREGSPHFWGPSPKAPWWRKVSQYWMNIDGEAGTSVQGFSSIDDIDHLRFDVTNIVYYLRPKSDVCVIGVGGGRDVQSAILFDSKKITGIELNPIFIKLHKNKFRKFSGIADYETVDLVIDEARSFLSRTDETYSILQMSLIDTWAATGAGAFSLSENTLYTLEAWQIFLNRLNNNGILSVSRWYHPDSLGETGRIVSLAAASLFRIGVKDVSAHIALITSGNIATLLLSKQPFSKQDIALLEKTISNMQYHPAVFPGVLPTNQVLKGIISSRSLKELDEAIKDNVLNLEPPTDDNPYFFNMLRLGPALVMGFISESQIPMGGVVSGNLKATITLCRLLLALLILAAATIIFPLVFTTRLRKEKPPRLFWSGAIYFILIGAGFMFVEIGLIQRLSVFLGHPVYALGILLFTIIASTGLGSLLSEHLPLKRFPWIFIYPILTVLTIAVTQFLLSKLSVQMVASGMVIKILTSVLLIFPLGIVLGLFFPTGMRLVKEFVADETPWYWALNGIFGVLCSALAVFLSIYFGIYMNFYISMFCYSTVLICLYHIYKVNKSKEVS